MISEQCFKEQMQRLQTAIGFKYETPLGEWLRDLNRKNKYINADLIKVVDEIRTAHEGKKEAERRLPSLPRLYGKCEQARKERVTRERQSERDVDRYDALVPRECVRAFTEALQMLPNGRESIGSTAPKDVEMIDVYRARCMEICEEYGLPYKKIRFTKGGQG